jgi:hypothetical protein
MDHNLQFLAERGISSPYAVGLMPYQRDDKGNIVVNYRGLSDKQIAQDAALSTVPNVGVPSAYVTYLDPTITTILFAVQNATRLFGEVRKGTWTDQYMNFPMEEIVGDVTPYSDFTNNVSSSVNYNFPTRENFIFQTLLKYGIREQETAGRAKLDYAGSKQRAAAQILARAHNRFYLYGVAGKQVYGALNDPNLNASETPISVNSKTTWADKVADQGNAATVSNVLFNDIAKLVNSLLSNNAGNVDQTTPMVLAVASDRYSYLLMPNSFGLTVLDLLKNNFPNMQVIQLPELSTDAGSMLYLTVPELLGEPTAENAFSEKMRFGNVETYSTSFVQKAIGATWGCVIRRPNLVATMTGV